VVSVAPKMVGEMVNVELEIEGRKRRILKAVVKDSDPIGRVTLGKSLGKRKLLILAVEYLDPKDRIFIGIKNKSEILPESTGTTRITESNSVESSLDSLAVRAMNFILDEFSNGRQPSMREVATHLGIGPRDLGKVLKPLGIEAQSTSRNWEHMRLYPLKLKARIEELLAS